MLFLVVIYLYDYSFNIIHVVSYSMIILGYKIINFFWGLRLYGKKYES